MPTVIERPVEAKADLKALRDQVQRKMREVAETMREMDALVRRLNAELGGPQPSALDDVQELLKATEDLRVENGKLSATAIARAFGVSVNELAGWLGRSRQAVTKTPDADSLQSELAYFERVARLRAVVKKDGFLKWLQMPNAQLDNQKPLDLLAGEGRQIVVDLVDDMLTGAPI